MKRIRSGDMVVVRTGKCKGQKGKVLKIADNKVIVEGINLQTKHVRPNPQLNEKGGIITREAAMHISNVALVNPVTGKADKVGFKFIEKDSISQKVRYFKSNNEIIDLV